MSNKTSLLVALSCIGFLTACTRHEGPSAPASNASVDVISANIQPNQGIDVPLAFSGKSFIGEKSKGDCSVSAKAPLLTVKCTALADAHLLSEPIELVTGRTYRISGMVKGTALTSSKEPNAGGVGLLSEKILVDFPTGSYDWRSFEVTFVVPKNGRRQISVGLGGWKTAQGTLEVKDLRLQQ